MNSQQAIDDLKEFIRCTSDFDFINSESEYFIPFYLESTFDDNCDPIFPHWSIKKGFYDYRCSEGGGLKEVSVIKFLEFINDFEDFSKKEKTNKISDTLYKFKCEVFRKIESYFDWNEEYSKFICYHNIRLLDELKDSIREKSLNDGVKADDYRSRIGKLGIFIHKLKWAFQHEKANSDSSFNTDDKVIKETEKNDKDKVRLWFHRNDQIINGTRIDENLDIHKEALWDVSCTYLRTPWLHHPWLDYWFLDALVYLELTSFRDDFISGRLGGDNSFIALDWYKAEGDLGEFTKKDAALDKPMWFGRTIIGYIGLNIIAPLITALTYIYFSKILGFIFAVSYVLLWIGLNEEERGEIKNCKEHLLILSMLHNLYKIFKQTPIDLNHLQSVATSYSSQTTGYLHSGICLDSIFHVILKKAIRENPDGVLWLHSFDDDE